MADKTITSDVLVAYSQCPRKAFLLLFSDDQGTPHDYPRILEERRKAHQAQYLAAFKQSHEDAKPYDEKNLRKGSSFVEATLKVECWEAGCDVLTKVDQGASSRKVVYEPTIAVGTYSITKEQKTELAFIGKVLGQIQKQLPAVGTIVGMDSKTHRVRLDSGYKAISPFLKTLQTWIEEKPAEPPTLILNKHCPSCQFRDLCREQAVKENNLSLLDRMTPKAIQKYNKRGIFTVQQLSYLFKPRRNRKRKTQTPVKHSLELQALAIREQKIYIQDLPELTRKPVELFLDIEGIPDQNFYYLMGLLVCEGENISYHCFWANSANDEEKIWKKLVIKINEYAGAPIYHYGSYESRMVDILENKYPINCEEVKKCLVNINSYIFGQIYFPTFSNGLKDIGSFLGFSWIALNSSGLQSLAWRHEWERSESSSLKKRLIDYNLDDCSALKVVVKTIEKVSNGFSGAEIGAGVEIASVDTIKDDSKYKFGPNQYLFQELDFVNKCSYFDYQREKVFFRGRKKKQTGKKVNKHSSQYRINKKIEISIPSTCSRCNSTDLSKHGRKYKTILDIKFFNFGVKRWVIRYSTSRVRCRACGKAFTSDDFHTLGSKYSNNLKIWIVYQMIALRQTYNLIQKSLNDVFGYQFNTQVFHNSKYEVADYYTPTYQEILNKLKNGQLIHADETSVSIQGKDAYIWVLTSLEEVIYIYSPTREGRMIKDTLNDFKGVLVSDFYSVYDSFECPQQKCLIHLIRDMNEDLRNNPFDEQYKSFIGGFSKLLQTIILTIDKHGLKKRFLAKHTKEAKRFIDTFLSSSSNSEVVTQYQRKFEKYQNKFFTFLGYDNIPWNNNNAEHAIKAFANYRKITNGCFSETGISKYLTLLSIYETCQYKRIDFFSFLRSRDVNINKFSNRA